MITNFLLYILYLVIKVVISPITLLPNASLPVGLSSALTTASGYISAFNTMLPMTTILLVVSTILIVELAIFTFKMINWVIKKIPFIS